MSQPYPPKNLSPKSDERARMKALVTEVNDRLRDLSVLLSEMGEIPLMADRVVTRFEVRESEAVSDSGVIIIAPPTDPPTLACAYYEDGEYTKVVWPCTQVDIPGGGTIVIH